MKAFTLLFLFIVFVSLPTYGISFGQDSKPDLAEIAHAHNRLYFSRLHERELPDSVIRRNIDKAEMTLMKSVGNGEKEKMLLIAKSRSEVFYLKGLLALRKQDLGSSLSMLDSAASWTAVVKDQDVSPSLADLTFINSGSVFRYRNSTRVLRRNVLKLMIENVYKQRNNQPESATIDQIKNLREVLNRETPGEGIYLDESVEQMYTYLVLSYNVKNKICEQVMKYYMMLTNGDYGYSDVPRLSPIRGLTSSQLSQREIEMRVAPMDYEMKEQPSVEDITAVQQLARTNCPDLFKNWTPEIPTEAAATMRAARPEGMLVLPKIPFTKSAWNKIPVSVNRFKNLGDLETFLSNTLKERGYDNFKYYGFEDGFAIITPIEKFNLNGKIYEGKGRFSTKMTSSINSFFDYIDKLFLAEKGHYRFIILAAASNPYSLGNRPTLDYMESLVADGDNRLSDEVAKKPLNNRFSVDGYVYEFEQNEFASDPIFVKEPTLTGREHIAPLMSF